MEQENYEMRKFKEKQEQIKPKKKTLKRRVW